MQSVDGGAVRAEGESAMVMSVERVGVRGPRVRWVPPASGSRGGEAIEAAAAVGLRLDAFQEAALMDACSVRENGKWAAFEAAVEMPRQNGKGGIIEARELAAILAWGERLVIHSSHEFQTSMEAMLRMEELLASTPDIAALVKSVSRSHGSEGFKFKTGQRLKYRTRTGGGGRGFTARDTLFLDEAMILKDAFIGALLPTLSARSVDGNPQVWYTGSAVDQRVHEHGLVFSRLRGRALRGGDPSLVYLGWSAVDPVDDDGRQATPDTVDPDLLADPEAWAAANPALGIRISHEHVENELRSMDPRTFAVERLGIGDWPNAEGGVGVFDLAAWDALEDPKSRPAGAVAFALDVAPDRSYTSIAVAGRREDWKPHVEIADRRRGTGWAVGRVAGMATRHGNVGVAVDASGPAASLLPELEEAGVDVTAVSAADHARACGRFFDAVEQADLRHLGSEELRSAVRGAARRPLGDAWGWNRRSAAVDISPLVASTLALWLATAAKPKPRAEAWAATW